MLVREAHNLWNKHNSRVKCALLNLLSPHISSSGRYMAGLYVYNVMQCPMEAIHGRQSLLHNAAAAGLIGYVGVSRGALGIPFVDPSFTYRYPQVSAPMLAFMVYGGLAGALAGFGGKRL